MITKRSSRIPWAGALLLGSLAALAVATAGLLLARRTESLKTKPPGNRVEDAFRETTRRIIEMENLWRSALEADATRMLADRSGTEAPPSARGIIQWSWLNPSFSQPDRAHHRRDGRPPSLKPVLRRFAKNNPDEWVFEEADALKGSGWIEEPSHPLAWSQGDDRAAVVFLLDPAAAAAIVRNDLASAPPSVPQPGETGALSWSGPDGNPWFQRGVPPTDSQPDEVMRHFSRFGEWTLRRWYPVRTVVTWNIPLLAGTFALAVALAVGGGAAAWQLRKALRRAEERVTFVNRVSHDLRTPLTNLLLHTDLAMDNTPAEATSQRRRLGLIREETSRLARIVDNVLAFARAERGSLTSRQGAFEPTLALAELRDTFAPLFDRKSIRCTYETSLKGTMALDSDAVSQILSNLLSNIERHAGEGARASVSIRRHRDDLVVEVRDDGPGIPPQDRERVFLPFESAGSRVDGESTGTGLGLAICRELASRMGGSLDLLPSSPGAVFRLTVPLTENTHR